MKSFWLLLYCISALLLCEQCQGHPQNHENIQQINFEPAESSQINQTPNIRNKRENFSLGQRFLGQMNNILCYFGLKKCTPRNNQNSFEVCKTPGCMYAASEMLSNMDLTVKPCDNFYKFACGNFLKNTVIPEDAGAASIFKDVADEIEQQLLSVIEEKSQPNEPKPFQYAKNMYKSCMDDKTIQKKGLKRILADLKKIGGWPVLEGNSWNENTFNWMTHVYNCRELGYSVDIFNSLDIETDSKNSTRRIIEISQPELGLERVLLVKGINDKIVNAYYNLMVDIAVIFGANRTRAEEEMLDNIKFTVDLANITLPIEETRNITKLYNPMTVKELEENYPNVVWKIYINKIIKPTVKIDDNEVVNVVVPSYFEKFDKLIKQTPVRTQANYFIWRIVEQIIPFLTKEIRDRHLQFSTIISGKTERSPRWKECLQISSNLISKAVDALYVRKYFNEESKKKIVELVNDIRQTFKSILQNVQWMDSETKKNALQKADAMSFYIAYPDELLDDKKVTEFYEKLTITSGDLHQSLLNISLFQYDYVFSQLRKPVNKSDWVTRDRPSDVDASYSLNENGINLSAGILQRLFFNSSRPRYMNYGGIGWIIGHEVTHGFDDEGRQFDKEGNLVDWWDEEAETEYLKKAECVIQQYGNYSSEEGLHLNGINTQGENIADNGGIKEAYLAYQNWVTKNGPEPRLPKLNYSQYQLFWINAAQVWCEKMRPEALENQILTDEHSPSEFRVLGSFSNMPEFAKDFNCPLDSNMNPKKKCSVW